MIYVVIDEPQVEDLGSSSPVCYLAHDILEDILPYLNVFPEETAEDTQNPEETGTAPDEYAVSTNANDIVTSTTQTETATSNE
jgi:stage V sporulation protein D (sporulation-specific penicillin-binding protein)